MFSGRRPLWNLTDRCIVITSKFAPSCSNRMHARRLLNNHESLPTGVLMSPRSRVRAAGHCSNTYKDQRMSPPQSHRGFIERSSHSELATEHVLEGVRPVQAWSIPGLGPEVTKTVAQAAQGAQARWADAADGHAGAACEVGIAAAGI